MRQHTSRIKEVTDFEGCSGVLNSDGTVKSMGAIVHTSNKEVSTPEL